MPIQQMMLGSGGVSDGEFIDNVFGIEARQGTSGTKQVTNGVNLSADGGLVITKVRAATGGPSETWHWVDTERGTGKFLVSDSDALEQTDTNGINTDAPRIINELALGYQQPNQRINPAIETLSNNIKTFGVFPKSMIDFTNRLTTLTFESDIDKQALVSMAIIKVNTIGKGKSGNLDKDGSLSEALDTVHELVNTHGIDFAVERFKTMVNSDFEDQKIRKDLMLDFAQTRFKSNDLREEFGDAFNGAIARTNLIDLE